MDRKHKIPLYQEIAESLRRRIAAGDLQPGDRLPPVREMAGQWDCTPGTVGRAYGVLAEEGLVTGHRGGGTRVTEAPLSDRRPQLRQARLVNQAERFLLEALAQGYNLHEAQSALALAGARWQSLQQADTPDTAAPARRKRLRFVGSHDTIAELLLGQLGEEVEVQFSGSLGGLIALARGEAELAGTHLWDEASGSYNVPFVKRILPHRPLALVTLARRELGLIVPPGNPQQLSSLADLVRPGVRWINRQPGSGTRVWLDTRLRQQDIPTAEIEGYDQDRSTHLAAAQAVSQGEATAALGIFPAAAAFELDFINLTQEIYQLVVPREIWALPVCQNMLSIMTSPSFLETAGVMGGYDMSATGEVSWL